LLLGVVNVVGVVTLSTMLADPISKLALYRQGLGFVLGLLPYLQTYAAAFFALPLLRLFVDGRRNVAIDERNDNRLEVRGGMCLLLGFWCEGDVVGHCVCRHTAVHSDEKSGDHCQMGHHAVCSVVGYLTAASLTGLILCCCTGLRFAVLLAAGCVAAAEWGP
jgi:hypothetical protein